MDPLGSWRLAGHGCKTLQKKTEKANEKLEGVKTTLKVRGIL